MLEKEEFEKSIENDTYKIEIPLTTNEELERVMKSYDSIINKVMETVSKDKDIIYLQAIIKEQHRRIEKQQKELNNLKERNKKQFEILCKYEDTLGHYECEVFNELGTVINIDKLVELDEIGIMGKRYISEDKIKEKIEEIKNYTYISKEERQCQNYAIDRLKELMEVDNK